MSDFSETTDRLRDLLVERAEEYYPAIFNAAPNRSLSSKKEQRYGRKGSLSVQLAGSKRGMWWDFETREGGGPFEAIMREQGCDFIAALDYARRVLLNLDAEGTQPRQERRASAKVERIDKAQEARLRKNIDRILGECRSIVGTPAETYLRKRMRGADMDFGALQNLRFHPHLKYTETGAYYPALISIVRDRQGVILGIQRTYLTEDGEKAPVPNAKLSLSAGKARSMGDGAVYLTSPNGTGEETTGEGLETVLSVLAAFPGITISATLGTSGIRNFTPHKSTTRLRFAGDPDKGGREAVAIRTEELTAENDELEIAAVFPPVEEEDFNALHKRAGLDAVQEAVRGVPFRCAEIRDFQAPIRERPAFQRNKLRGVRLVDTEAAAAEAVDAFLASKQLASMISDALADADDARSTSRTNCAHVIRAPAGLGKTVVALKELLRRIQQPLTIADNGKAGPYFYLVPNYDLAQEVAAKARAMVRLEMDPTGPQNDESDQINGKHGILIFQGKSRSCSRPDELQALTNEGLSSAGLCMSKDKRELCPLIETCFYQRQKAEVENAKLVILVHEYLTVPSLPAELNDPRAVIVDETVFRQLVRVARVSLDSLASTPSMPRANSEDDRIEWQRRAKNRAILATDAIEALEKGHDPAQAIRLAHKKRLADVIAGAERHGLCPKAEADACRLHDWLADAKRIAGGDDYSSAGISPGMTLKQIKDHIARYKSGTSKGEAAFWKQVKERVILLDEAEAYDGDAENAPKVPLPLKIQLRQEGPASDPRRVVRTAWMANRNWQDIPFIFLDAHADPAFIEPSWPGCQVHEVHVRTQGTIVQIADHTYGKSSLLPTPNASLEDKVRCAAELDRIRQLIATTASKHRQFLVIAMKEVIEALVLGWTPPVNAAFRHYGALRGLDQYKDFDGCLLLGRMQPPTSTLDEYSAAYYDGSQEPPLPLDAGDGKGAQLPLAPAHYRLKTGEVYQKEVPQGPTALHRAVLAQFREAELEQGIARLRLVHRTSPATIYVLTSIPLDMEIDQLVSIKDLTGEETRLARAMREAGGVLVASPRALTGFAGAVFKSDAAARDELKARGVRAETLLSQAESLAQERGGVSYNKPIGISPPFLSGFVVARIRWKQQRGSDSAALIEAGVSDPEAAVRAALKRAGLELDKFEIAYQPPTAEVIPLPKTRQGTVCPGEEDVAVLEVDDETAAMMLEGADREVIARTSRWEVTTWRAYAALDLQAAWKEANRLRIERERLEMDRTRQEEEKQQLSA